MTVIPDSKSLIDTWICVEFTVSKTRGGHAALINKLIKLTFRNCISEEICQMRFIEISYYS